MNLLAADCATAFESVALLRDGDVLVEHGAVRRGGAGATLLDTIDAVLADAGLRLAGVDGFVVGLGPGSFTGLRVALATLKGLALARDLPLWGVSTTTALRGALPGERVVPVIDARRGEVFVGVDPPRCVPPAEAAALIDGPAVLLGNGALLYADVLRKLLPEARIPALPALHHPRAALLVTGDLGPPAALATLEPLYVRKSDAEIHYPDGFPDATVVPVQRHPKRR
jgi:tRNA threonylcarbamoyladenosine biosynthesis protein TsaB